MQQQENLTKRIYCDANASTPLDPRVYETYMQACRQCWANPSSVHQEGQKARSMLADARARCAALFRVQPQQIVFFSSATEALNTALYSFFAQARGTIITTDVEHAALYEPCKKFAQQKNACLTVAVGARGTLEEKVVRSLCQRTPHAFSGIATSLANTETGVILPLDGIVATAKKEGLSLFLDGVAALGKMPITLNSQVTGICFSSHKIYAPKGVGVLVMTKGWEIEPLVLGGKQEQGRRAGTENVPAISAFAYALQLVLEEQEASLVHMTKLRDALEKTLLDRISGSARNGEGERIANTSNLFIPGVEGEELQLLLDQKGIAISVGSACASGAIEPSRVISNMYSRQRALASIRISLHKFSTADDIDKVASVLEASVRYLRR